LYPQPYEIGRITMPINAIVKCGMSHDKEKVLRHSPSKHQENADRVSRVMV